MSRIKPCLRATGVTLSPSPLAMHVFCRQQRRRGSRLSRHWHDAVRLDDAGYADLAIADRPLALSVAHHKSKFFADRT